MSKYSFTDNKTTSKMGRPNPRTRGKYDNDNGIELSSPLREDDTEFPPRRPTVGPELDDLPASGGGDGESETFIPRSRPPGEKEGSEVDDMVPPKKNPRIPPDREPEEPGFDDGSIDPEDPAIIPPGRRLPDVNVYQQKKTLAQGMMDLALLSANANQLRYIFEQPPEYRGGFFYTSLTFISMSVILQIAVGLGLIWNSRYNIKKDGHIHRANQANNFTLIGIFLVTILNVFISAFGVIPLSPDLQKQELSIAADPDFEISTENLR